MSPAATFATFAAEEGRNLGKSTADLGPWAPPPKAKRAKKASKKKAPPPGGRLRPRRSRMGLFPHPCVAEPFTCLPNATHTVLCLSYRSNFGRCERHTIYGQPSSADRVGKSGRGLRPPSARCHRPATPATDGSATTATSTCSSTPMLPWPPDMPRENRHGMA